MTVLPEALLIKRPCVVKGVSGHVGTLAATAALQLAKRARPIAKREDFMMVYGGQIRKYREGPQALKFGGWWMFLYS